MLLGFGGLGGLGFRAPGVRVWGSGFACVRYVVKTGYPHDPRRACGI